ncbi:hypothetical protein pkur_cds_609 [Pandoravirus kuranda]|uniref:Uncharacterized protein n=1 Tax=Pandoravirus kuranda TaxID=3019033 RepID=A0AA95EEZ5_9VIRU|nr:hypothetical protein pkur_cds_609 [Pandoravirus kuranda]
MSARDQHSDRRGLVLESVHDLAATCSSHEEQPALLGEREAQGEAPVYASCNDGATASAIDEDAFMEDATDDSVHVTRSDALVQFRQGVTLWRLSDCTTLGEQPGGEDSFISCL